MLDTVSKAALLETIEGFRSKGVVLAFSGGVDSALLLALLAKSEVPLIAVTFQTVLHPSCDMENAKAVAKRYNVPHVVLEVDEFENPAIINNPPDRCYHCKRQLFETLLDFAQSKKIPYVLDGTNTDDLSAYRPGLRALRELGIRSPLAECGITKAEVRALALENGMETASRPSSPCMATRLPYDTPISRPLLSQIEIGEQLLKDTGFPVLRLRVHPASCGDLARIEIPPEDFLKFLDKREIVVRALREIGFEQITLDLEGFRSGSYDRALPIAGKPEDGALA